MSLWNRTKHKRPDLLCTWCTLPGSPPDKLNGVFLHGFTKSVVLSAYADNLVVFFQQDIAALTDVTSHFFFHSFHLSLFMDAVKEDMQVVGIKIQRIGWNGKRWFAVATPEKGKAVRRKRTRFHLPLKIGTLCLYGAGHPPGPDLLCVQLNHGRMSASFRMFWVSPVY